MYTIAALDTVAGEATARSYISNRSLTFADRAILSPLFSVNNLLSSSTEFSDSIQRVSTGPSRIIHLCSTFSRQILLSTLDRIPSFHYGGF